MHFAIAEGVLNVMMKKEKNVENYADVILSKIDVSVILLALLSECCCSASRITFAAMGQEQTIMNDLKKFNQFNWK